MIDHEEPESARCCVCEKVRPISLQVGIGGALCRPCAIEYGMRARRRAQATKKQEVSRNV